LGPEQRWGFKEIRYHSLITARFLAELFPWSRFVLLRRDLKEVVASSVLAPWSLNSLTDVKSREDVEHVVQDCARAVCAMHVGLGTIAAGLPERVLSIGVADLVDGQIRERLFEFLALRLDDTIRAKIAVAASERLGATPPASLAGVGRPEIEAMAEAAIHSEERRDKRPPRRDYRYLVGWPRE
jgi:hypothetical protein